MIFVTVGTHYQGFDRLVRSTDEMAKRIDEEVLIQYGSSNYLPKYSSGFRYVEREKFINYIRNSRIVICHGGVGTILDILLNDKRPIIVPRQKKFKEASDDHQFEIAWALEKKGVARVVWDINDFEQIIFTHNSDIKHYISKNRKKLVTFISYLLNSIES